jgi:hypothetical protein
MQDTFSPTKIKIIIALVIALIGVLLYTSYTNKRNASYTAVADTPLAVSAVDIRMRETFPVQVEVLIDGTLAEGCRKVGTTSQQKSGSTFYLVVRDVSAGVGACESSDVIDHSVVLEGVDTLTRGTYVVDVNGIKRSFELQADNMLVDESLK